jgi:hypothetical protein
MSGCGVAAPCHSTAERRRKCASGPGKTGNKDGKERVGIPTPVSDGRTRHLKMRLPYFCKMDAMLEERSAFRVPFQNAVQGKKCNPARHAQAAAKKQTGRRVLTTIAATCVETATKSATGGEINSQLT